MASASTDERAPGVQSPDAVLDVRIDMVVNRCGGWSQASMTTAAPMSSRMMSCPPSDSIEIWSYRPPQIDLWVRRVSDDVASGMIEPALGGLRWFYTVFPPGAHTSSSQRIQGVDENGFHTTRTIDFAYLLSGKVTLLLDRDSIHLQAGDVVVQQVARHAWQNDGTEPAIVLFTLHKAA